MTSRWCVTSWGSLGALVMNQHMVDFVARECQEGQPFHHIYGVGQRYYSRVLEALKERGIDLADYPDVDVREYIYDMPVVMDGADRDAQPSGRFHHLRDHRHRLPQHPGALSQRDR